MIRLQTRQRQTATKIVSPKRLRACTSRGSIAWPQHSGARVDSAWAGAPAGFTLDSPLLTIVEFALMGDIFASVGGGQAAGAKSVA